MSNVLVLEDEVIIALDLEMTLNELGFEEILIASSVNQALTLVAANDIAFAILDFNLGAETAQPVIERLEERGIPFVVMSGYMDRTHLGDGAADWLLLGKPANAVALSQALETLGIDAIPSGGAQAQRPSTNDGSQA